MTSQELIEIKQLLLPQVALLASGHCPWCEKYIKGYEAPVGSFAPEMWETMREHGTDPGTGHSQNCTHRKFRIL